jgi:hypothetical protein
VEAWNRWRCTFDDGFGELVVALELDLLLHLRRDLRGEAAVVRETNKRSMYGIQVGVPGKLEEFA